MGGRCCKGPGCKFWMLSLAFSHVLGRSWAKVAREKDLCFRSEGRKELRRELSDLDRHLGEGDNWYKELASSG